ncbi:MAG: T9SS type A sorting domain-containing protein, partial [Luteibaculum sp.]
GFDGSNLIQLWGDAANGPVLDILYNPNNNRLEVAGEFTELSSNFGSSYTLNAPIVSIDFNGNIFEKSNLNFNNIAEGIDHLALSGQQLIIGGNFSTINGKDFGELFFYDGNSPQSLAGSLEFFSGGVQSMYVQEGKLWVGGGIMRANGFPSTNIAQYSLGSVSGNGSVVVDMIPEDNIEHYDVLSYCIPNPEPGANYVWSNGDTGPCTIFTESGYQTITATGFPCYAPDSVLVEIIYAGFTRGGFGDGFDDGLVENQNATFFSGGYGDGFDGEIFENNSPGFFAGGFGDGFDSDEFVNDNPTFFAGGFGDGFDSELKENNSPTFFSGGFGDGFDTEEFKNQSPTFFRGGFGDGFDCAENDGYDLAIRNLSTVPGQPTNQPQTLLVWVINEGSVPVDDYEIEILEEGQQLYTEGFSKLVAPGDSIQNKLTTEWRPQENGQFELCAVLLGAGDYNPNNDSTCFTATSTVGIAQLFSSEGILVSPNPFSNQINIRFTQPKEKLQLELIAADGKRVLMQTIRKATHEIILDTQNLAKGFYSLRIQGKDLNLSHKILKSE